MLREQTEECGNLPFLYFILQTNNLFQKMLEDKLINTHVRDTFCNCQSKSFFTLVFCFITTSSRLAHEISPSAVPITYLGYNKECSCDMKVSECNSCDVEIRISEVNMLTSGCMRELRRTLSNHLGEGVNLISYNLRFKS